MNQVAEKPALTDEQLELLTKLCIPQKVLCLEMGLSELALQARIRRLVNRFGVENQRALLVKALRLGIIDLEFVVYREF
jgi:DNA-binding NarL/FixJ family response regulator